MLKHEKSEILKGVVSGASLGAVCALSLEKGAALAIVLANPASWALVGGGALAGGLVAGAWSKYQHRAIDKEIQRIIQGGQKGRRHPRRARVQRGWCSA